MVALISHHWAVSPISGHADVVVVVGYGGEHSKWLRLGGPNIRSRLSVWRVQLKLVTLESLFHYFSNRATSESEEQEDGTEKSVWTVELARR